MHKKELQQGADLFEEDGSYYVKKIKNLCKENNLQFFVAIFPYLKPLSEYKDYEINDYQTINKVIKSADIKYINLYELLPEQELYSLRDNKEDEMHPSSHGHAVIAEIIYNYLLKYFFTTYK